VDDNPIRLAHEFMSVNDMTSPAGRRKGLLICPVCGHTSDAVDGDWIAVEMGRHGRRFRCPSCGYRFGDQSPIPTPA